MDKPVAKILTVIPFSGFYCTYHEDQFDSDMEMLFQDEDGIDLPWADKMREHFSDKTDWTKAFNAYAKQYVSAFAEEFKIPSLEFESLQMPKEYNFTTDRIFVLLSVEDFERVFRELKPENMQAKCTEELTSRSGFMSFYTPEYKLWGAHDQWDHNQYGMVLSAYADQESDGEFDNEKENDLCDDFSGNGHIQNWLFEFNPQANRLESISNYLKARWDRVACEV